MRVCEPHERRISTEVYVDVQNHLDMRKIVVHEAELCRHIL